MRTIIRGAEVVSDGRVQNVDVAIESDKIAEVAKSIAASSEDQVIDAEGHWLIPGLIDDQVHFREPGLTHKADIYTESRAAVAGGITSYFEMPNTLPQTVTQSAMQDKLKTAAEKSHANYAFMFGGTNDNIEEILKTDWSRVPALKLFLGSSTGNMLVDDRRVLREIFSKVKVPIALHCEDEETIRKNLAFAKAKYGDDIPMHMHPVIRSEEACYKSSSMAIELANETGARAHVFHLSTGKESRQFQSNPDVTQKQITSEVCVHHLFFTDEDYGEKGSLIKWNPAVKTKRDREELWDALIDDRIDILATDHAPHTLEEKSNPYTSCPSGGPLVQHTLPALLKFVDEGRVSIEKIVQKACHNPALLFDVVNRGFIREGYAADLVLVKRNSPWTVTEDNILAKCGWSPFTGMEFNNQVSHTFINGKLAYADGMVSNERHAAALSFDR